MIRAGARTGAIYDLLAPPLILVTPFIDFTQHNGYGYATPEFWICVAGLAAIGLVSGIIMALGGTWLRVLGTAGLLTLFVDLQFDWFDSLPHLWVPAGLLGAILLCWLTRKHLSRVVTAIFAAMLAPTLALYVLGGELTSSNIARMRTGVDPAPANGLSTIVHIVLDEHMGIEGIPEVPDGRETKALIKSFFQSHGFHLFGQAYSRYADTRNSIPNMLNYASQPTPRSWTDGDKWVVLRSNKYFEDLHEAGYDIHVFQIVTMDLCQPSRRILTTCYTEDHTGMKSLQYTGFSSYDKAVILYQFYSRLSQINYALHGLNSRARAFAERNGWTWPEWWSAGAGMPAVRALYEMSIVSDAVMQSRPGDFFFAHLLTPHYPYIYDARCNERNQADWESAAEDDPLPPNTMQSRQRRYALYFEQVQCTYKKLGEMFEKWQVAGVFQHATIIIQGDHGSRINLNRPQASKVEQMLISDYADSFSTLLAVKAPGYEPGYDLRPVAIQDVLPQLALQSRPRQMAQGGPARLTPSPESPPYVFLQGDGAGPMKRQPLPDFDAPGVAPLK
jgi:hypothetical protein